MQAVPKLRVYPRLWRMSRARFPHPPQWPDHLELLCSLARDFCRRHRRLLARLPPGEKMFLRSLADVDVGDFISMLRSDFPAEINPLSRIDPADPLIDRHQDPFASTRGRFYHA
jgi:hypothetical protein